MMLSSRRDSSQLRDDSPSRRWRARAGCDSPRPPRRCAAHARSRNAAASPAASRARVVHVHAIERRQHLPAALARTWRRTPGNTGPARRAHPRPAAASIRRAERRGGGDDELPEAQRRRLLHGEHQRAHHIFHVHAPVQEFVGLEVGFFERRARVRPRRPLPGKKRDVRSTRQGSFWLRWNSRQRSSAAGLGHAVDVLRDRHHVFGDPRGGRARAAA